jgi:hypothetical protein
MMGGFHVDDSASYFGFAVGWSFTSLALQQGLGILPQRWARVGSRCVVGITSGRAAVAVALFAGLWGFDFFPGEFI